MPRQLTALRRHFSITAKATQLIPIPRFSPCPDSFFFLFYHYQITNRSVFFNLPRQDPIPKFHLLPRGGLVPASPNLLLDVCLFYFLP
jgi:hypothetical protein